MYAEKSSTPPPLPLSKGWQVSFIWGGDFKAARVSFLVTLVTEGLSPANHCLSGEARVG